LVGRGSVTLVLIDADPVVYRCGFAAEKTNWHVIYEDVEGIHERVFRSSDTHSGNDYFKDWLELHKGYVTVHEKDKQIIPDPVSYALRAVKVQIESIMEECTNKYSEGCQSLMWLSGGKNYRDKIATVRPYKGNRDPLHKPYHYAAIREYLRDYHGAFITNGIEADDAISISARAHKGLDRIVIATIDKDLDQIPGYHYNYMQKVHYAVTRSEAEEFFVQQILSGDPTDNIVGCWKCGPAAARKIAGRFNYASNGRAGAGVGVSAGILESDAGGAAGSTGESGYTPPPLVGESGDAAVTEGSGELRSGLRYRRASDLPARLPQWWSAVVAEYSNSQRKAGCPYAQNDSESIVLEMAQLVKLQEYPGQLWTPYGDMVVPGFGEEDFDGQV
jgi:hypothetical protein